MDAVAVLYMSKWLVAELVRIFHGVDPQTAAASVEAIVERTLPIVWQVGDKRRVLKPGLSKKDETLVLLYHIDQAVPIQDLVAWVEYSNISVYKRKVLLLLHKARLVEYDAEALTVRISPSGRRQVEEKIELDF
jgi:hypothetical protein